jgi:hypothetical protein
MGPGPQASHQKGAFHQTRRGLPRKTEKFLKFVLRLTFAAKARRAKETKEKIMEIGG